MLWLFYAVIVLILLLVILVRGGWLWFDGFAALDGLVV